MPVLVTASGRISTVFAFDAQVVQIYAILARAGKPMRQVRSPKGNALIGTIEIVRILFYWTVQKRCYLPGRTLIEKLDTIELKGNVRRCAGCDETARAQTHAVATNAQSE